MKTFKANDENMKVLGQKNVKVKIVIILLSFA